MRPFPPYQAQQRRAEQELVTTVDKAHGRRERRTLETTTALNQLLAQLGWSSVRQVFRVTRQRTVRDRDTGDLTTKTDVAFGITSLTRQQANAERLLHFNRGHWGIENKTHYPRDVTFGEDANQAKTRHGPQHLAAARNTAITLCRLYGYLNLAAARREFAWNPSRLFAILGFVMN
jgi:predicted transposase YbfD/YdcC